MTPFRQACDVPLSALPRRERDLSSAMGRSPQPSSSGERNGHYRPSFKSLGKPTAGPPEPRDRDALETVGARGKTLFAAS
jgi:hypothetical protein